MRKTDVCRFAHLTLRYVVENDLKNKIEFARTSVKYFFEQNMRKGYRRDSMQKKV